MLARLAGLVLGRAPFNYGDGEAEVRMNPRGEMCVAAGLPQKTELVRLGDTWTCAIATGSAFTFVNAWPTTRAELVIYNADNVKSLILESAFLTNITSQAAAQPYSLLGQILPPNMVATKPTQDTAQLIWSRSGRGAYGGNVVRAVANTAFGQIANRWEILGNAVISPMTTNLGGSLSVDLQGAWIVPPGGGFCLAGLAGTAAGTAICGVTWHEAVLPVVS